MHGHTYKKDVYLELTPENKVVRMAVTRLKRHGSRRPAAFRGQMYPHSKETARCAGQYHSPL